jgi:hypothetical protein
MRLVECFKIQILSYENEDSILDIKKGTSIYRVPCLDSSSKLDPTIIVADPFLFVHNNRLYLFYESKSLEKPGVLKMVSTPDLRAWTKPVTVLREPFHLSYPFVFEENGKVYMIPETCADKSIRLYEADNNGLTSFSIKKRILVQSADIQTRMGYSDSSIYKKDGIYYLMTMLQYTEKLNILKLYTSNSLLGPYKEHPCSPIAKSQKVGRDAGSWMDYKGKLLRFSQDCVNRYGDNVNVSEITELSPSSYKEKLVKENIIPTDVDFYKYGGHQFNVAYFNGKWIVATDAKEYRKLIFPRILWKLKRVL